MTSSLILATHNQGKVRELGALLQPLGFSVTAAGDLGVTEPEETENTFAGNALLKAKHTCNATNLPSLADDSGLCVPALNNAPGIYSARWAGEHKDFTLAMQRVENKLKALQTNDYSAYFVCALALCLPSGEQHVFEGRIDGTLTFPPRGDKGFGYDPIFIPKGYTQTFAEMEPSEKHALSHRARAFEKFVEFLSTSIKPFIGMSG